MVHLRCSLSFTFPTRNNRILIWINLFFCCKLQFGVCYWLSLSAISYSLAECWAINLVSNIGDYFAAAQHKHGALQSLHTGLFSAQHKYSELHNNHHHHYHPWPSYSPSPSPSSSSPSSSFIISALHCNIGVQNINTVQETSNLAPDLIYKRRMISEIERNFSLLQWKTFIKNQVRSLFCQMMIYLTIWASWQ